jgi:hypothetical protein
MSRPPRTSAHQVYSSCSSSPISKLDLERKVQQEKLRRVRKEAEQDRAERQRQCSLVLKNACIKSDKEIRLAKSLKLLRAQKWSKLHYAEQQRLNAGDSDGIKTEREMELEQNLQVLLAQQWEKHHIAEQRRRSTSGGNAAW